VVGFDGSPDAQRALGWAAGLAAARPGTPIHLVRSVSLPPIPHHHADLTVGELLDRHERDARRELDEARGPLEARGIRVEIHLRRWLAAETVVEHADRAGAGLIVVGRHGTRPARLLLGSVSGEIAASASRPVVVVRGGRAPTPPRRILLGFDGSPCALRAAATLGRWTPEAEILVLSVGSAIERADDLDELVAAGLERDRLERLTRSGDPAEALLEVAETSAVDLVAAGRRGRSGWQELLVGGVSEKLLQLAPCPVLVAH